MTSIIRVTLSHISFNALLIRIIVYDHFPKYTTTYCQRNTSRMNNLLYFLITWSIFCIFFKHFHIKPQEVASASPTINEFRCWWIHNCQPCNGLLLFLFQEHLNDYTSLHSPYTKQTAALKLFQFCIFTPCFMNMHNFFQYIFIQNTLINQMMTILQTLPAI